MEEIDLNVLSACNKSVTENYVAVFHRFLIENDGTSRAFGAAMCPSCSIIQVDVKDPIEESVVKVVSKRAMRTIHEKVHPERILEAALKRHALSTNCPNKSKPGRSKNRHRKKISTERAHIRDSARSDVKSLSGKEAHFQNFNLSGMLCFMPHFILVPPCIGKETIHAVGRQKVHDEKGVIHCVIPDDLAKSVMAEANEEQFKNHPKRSRMIFCKTTCHKLPLNTVDPCRWPIKMEDTEMINRWLAYARDPDWVAPVDYRGTYPTVEELLHCEIISPENIEDINILSVLLEPELKNADWHLGALIFLDPLVPIYRDVMEDEDYPGNTNLLEELLPFCSKNGVSAERPGGANGLMDVSSPIFRYFLTRQGLVPKIKCATIFIGVNSRKRNGFQVIYTSPYGEKGCKSFFYAPPQIGGVQKLSESMLKRNRLLLRFPACRVLGAIICIQFNNTVKLQERHLVEAACWKMMDEWDLSVQKSSEDKGLLKNSMYHLARDANLTVITHKVGYHRDVFAGSK